MLSDDVKLREVCELIFGALERAREMKTFRIQSTFDELTGLLNRRGLFDVLAREQARSDRYSRNVSVLFVDLNKFKPINDTYGHKVGDEALVTVARALEGAVRTTDIVGRLGGDEFFVILPDISAEGAVMVQERITEAVADVMFCVGAERIALSISVGAATHEPGMSAEQLIERADHAMYAMKRSNAATGVFSSRIKLDELVGRIHAA
jgi:diguanylate cyclase